MLIFVFGGLIAASLPVGIGIFAIVLTFTYLRLVAPLHRCVDLRAQSRDGDGLALAIDYTLLLLTRYREELSAGRSRDAAIVATMATAGAPCCSRPSPWRWRWPRW